MSKPTVLITGISGFIARHCALEMLRSGYRVRGTVRAQDKADSVSRSLARHVDTEALEFAEADLMSDAGWKEAVAGCKFVLHVASPFPAGQPKDEQALILPAVDGTRRVMAAAAAASVERLIQTSSMVAVMYGHPPARTAPFSEIDWTDVDARGVTPYARSKTLAERAARAFMKSDRSGMQYASVNPGFVLGPVLDADVGTSAEVIQMFLRGKYPGAPRISMPCVDVRDIAKMHRLALEVDAASGGRYLGVSETPWMLDIARAIRAGLGPQASKVPSRQLPDWVLRIVGIFDPIARQVVPELGKELRVDNSQTRKTLGLSFIPAGDAAVAMARSLIDLDLV
jgi:nucleoside-diphosphate-sugar epimerase